MPGGTCRVVSLRGFLKLQCMDSNKLTYYKCSHSNTQYQVAYAPEAEFNCSDGRNLMFDEICDQDPGFYQICGHQMYESHHVQMDQEGMLCGEIACNSEIPWKPVDNEASTCNEELDPDKEKGDETHQFDCRVYRPKRNEFVPENVLCDDECDCSNCADESLLGNNRCASDHPVGMMCNKTFQVYSWSSNPKPVTKEVYIEPKMICDNITHCDDNADEINCTEESEESCMYENFGIERTWPEEIIKKLGPQKRSLAPSHKCSVPNFLSINPELVCDDFSDQLNCPNKLKNELECFASKPDKEDAKLINLSKYLVDCEVRYRLEKWIKSHNSALISSKGKEYSLKAFCNDSIDDQCYKVGHRCLVHKHKMCDNHIDCPTKKDETDDICKDMEDKTCIRRVGGVEAKIPSKWVEDGVTDCVDGIDENNEYWIKHRENYSICGDKSDWSSVRSDNCSNERFYFCSNSTKEKLAFNKLCDRISSCGSEEQVCRVARNQDIFWSKPILGPSRALSRGFLYCLPGLENMISLANGCKEIKLKKTMHGDEVFGVKYMTGVVPNRTFDCTFLYGTPYLLTSCNRMCTDETTKCKMPSLKHNSCKAEIPEEYRTYTVATPTDGSASYLTLVRKVGRTFRTLPFFECDSGACIAFDKVCNLANDCEDWSDEKDCLNQFSCNGTADRIPWDRYCDGAFDCLDYSDECGNDCNRNRDIIDKTPLVVCSWTIGLMATLLNLVAIIATFVQLLREISLIKAVNLALILVIGLGDFCVGLYLLAISIVDYRYKTSGPSTFCRDYYKWLTSDACSALGVLNTFGSQLSLYSMTLLSIFRVFCLKNSSLRGSLKWKGKSVTILICVSMVLSAAAISLVPLFPQLEDYFVNGLAYFNNPMLIGSHDKDNHIAILREHYGKFKIENLSWRQIIEMVANMFSRFNNNPVIGNKVNFYGNSGVCLFKFFVRENDPQKMFTWFVIIQNALCFLIISMSYLLIHTKLAASTRKVSQKKDMKKTSAAQKKQSNKNSALNRKITLMVLTDFMCWVPFIVVCSLHFFEVIDATKWYSLFSIIILPLNSVINPLLYDNSGLLDFICTRCLKTFSKAGLSEMVPHNFGLSTIRDSVSGKSKVEVPEQSICSEPDDLRHFRCADGGAKTKQSETAF